MTLAASQAGWLSQQQFLMLFALHSPFSKSVLRLEVVGVILEAVLAIDVFRDPSALSKGEFSGTKDGRQRSTFIPWTLRRPKRFVRARRRTMSLVLAQTRRSGSEHYSNPIVTVESMTQYSESSECSRNERVR